LLLLLQLLPFKLTLTQTKLLLTHLSVLLLLIVLLYVQRWLLKMPLAQYLKLLR
jgi:hypothetical protein